MVIMNVYVVCMCLSICLSLSLKLFIVQYECIILCIVFMLSTNKKKNVRICMAVGCV